MSKTFWILIGSLIVLAVAVVSYFVIKAKPAEVTPVTTKTEDTTPLTKTITASWKEVGPAVTGTYADADIVSLRDGSKRMYYGIQPEIKGNNLEIYSSTSPDGITWKQESGTRKKMATFPDVVPLEDGTWRMYFQSAGVIKSATSPDGLTWTDDAGTRIDAANNLGLSFENVAAPTVYMLPDATYVMVYRGTINEAYKGEPVPNKNTQILLWATSADGLAWTKKGLALDSRNTTLYGLADGPELFTWEDGTVTLSFWSYTGVYWSKFADDAFSAPEKVFARIEGTATNKFPADTAGDPVYAKFGDIWYMYYGQKAAITYAVATLK